MKNPILVKTSLNSSCIFNVASAFTAVLASVPGNATK